MDHWWIQDLPEEGEDVKSYYLFNFSPKNCMKLKEFGGGGGGRGGARYTDVDVTIVMVSIITR